MIFSKNLVLPEGPVALADGTWLVVEGGSRGCVTQISADGRKRRTVAQTGMPNGLAVDSKGTIWVAETKTPSLLRTDLNGATELVLTECEGRPLLYPNDLCFGPDGALFLTDSGILASEFEPGGVVRSDYMSVPTDGRIFRIDLESGHATAVDSGLRFVNGIAFGPDGDLYVSETITGAIYRYRRRGRSAFGNREEIANVIDPATPSAFKGPDGMAFGADGKLYVAVIGQAQVAVVALGGALVSRTRTEGKLPTNVAFDHGGQSKLYVTEYELGQIEVYDVETGGFPLYG